MSAPTTNRVLYPAPEQHRANCRAWFSIHAQQAHSIRDLIHWHREEITRLNRHMDDTIGQLQFWLDREADLSQVAVQP